MGFGVSMAGGFKGDLARRLGAVVQLEMYNGLGCSTVLAAFVWRSRCFGRVIRLQIGVSFCTSRFTPSQNLEPSDLQFMEKASNIKARIGLLGLYQTVIQSRFQEVQPQA